MKLFTQSKHKEQGRSMVEMLGVLAIIGVLSIGGIAGYTMAMNRYKANQLLDIASKLSIMAQTGAAADPDNWNGLTEEMFHEVGVDRYSNYMGGIGQYETTFSIYDDGSVDVGSGNQGIQNALKSITGSENPGITVE